MHAGRFCFNVVKGGAGTEAVLNLAWALLCIGALSYEVWGGPRRTGVRSRAWRVRRAISVFVAAVALFPVISASDDRLRLADINTAPVPQTASIICGTHNSAPSAPLEDPEHGQTAAPFLPVGLLALFFVPSYGGAPRPAGRFASRFFGRAPPFRPAHA